MLKLCDLVDLDTGELTYKSYWRHVIFTYLLENKSSGAVTIEGSTHEGVFEGHAVTVK